MSDEVYEYFLERYQKAKFRVVPGHCPNFKSKEHVDKWFKFVDDIMSTAFKEAFKSDKTK